MRPTGEPCRIGVAHGIQKAISPAETNIVSRHWHYPNAINSSTANSKRTAKKSKLTADSRDGRAVDRSKPSEQTRRWDRSAAFSGFLRSLSLAPDCDSGFRHEWSIVRSNEPCSGSTSLQSLLPITRELLPVLIQQGALCPHIAPAPRPMTNRDRVYHLPTARY